MKDVIVFGAPTYEDLIVFGALVGALGIIVLCVLVRKALTVLDKPMGPPNYDFSASYASSITVVGALLGTILGAGVVPTNTHYLPQSVYGALNLLFGIIVVLAPFVYRAMSRRVESKDDKGPPIVQHQGCVGTFLLAVLLTVWAVIGELVTTLLLFGELQESRGVLVLLFVLVGATLVLVAIYTWNSVSHILEDAIERKRAATPDGKADRPSWSLL